MTTSCWLPDLDWEALASKFSEVNNWAPTRGPYRVESYNRRRGEFYVSGSACNALGAAAFFCQPIAQTVADFANKTCGYAEKKP